MTFSRREILRVGCGFILPILTGCTPDTRSSSSSEPTPAATPNPSDFVMPNWGDREKATLQRLIYSTAYYTNDLLSALENFWNPSLTLKRVIEIRGVNDLPIQVQVGYVQDSLPEYADKGVLQRYTLKTSFRFNTTDNNLRPDGGFINPVGLFSYEYSAMPKKIIELKRKEEAARLLAFVVGITAALSLIGITPDNVEYQRLEKANFNRYDLSTFFRSIISELIHHSAIPAQIRGILYLNRNVDKQLNGQPVFLPDPATGMLTPVLQQVPVPYEDTYASVYDKFCKNLLPFNDLGDIQSPAYPFFDSLPGFKYFSDTIQPSSG